MAVPPPAGLAFGRSRRVTANRDFQRAKTKGRRLPCGCLIANWLYLPKNQTTRAGFVTSKQIGPAVLRNRARRLLRESFRLHQHKLAGPIDLILVARHSIGGKSFCQVEKDFLTAIRKAGLLKESPA
jgi:ribonuclease P protein component